VGAKPLVLDPAAGEAVERAAADLRGDRDEADLIVDRDLPDVGRRDPDPGGQRPDDVTRPQSIAAAALDRDRDHRGWRRLLSLHRRDPRARDPGERTLPQIVEDPAIRWMQQADREPAATGARGAADAMHEHAGLA